MSQWKINGKKYVLQSTQYSCENGLTITQKEVIKYSVHLETIEKYRNLV